MNKVTVITGNPVDGFTFYGPFDEPNEAGDWALNGNVEADWWVSDLIEPEEA